MSYNFFSELLVLSKEISNSSGDVVSWLTTPPRAEHRTAYLSPLLSCHPISVKVWEKHLPYFSRIRYFYV
jgi:hypothetical protein